MAHPVLDFDLLRSLVLGIEAGSFARASERIGRTQSAVSLQMKKLEEALDVDIFEKNGRSLTLTPAGQTLHGYARRLLELHDEAVDSVRGVALTGHVRFGMSVDFENTWLPATIARFSRAHLDVSMEVNMERNSVLATQIKQGGIDLALVFGYKHGVSAEQVAELDMIWIGRPDLTLRPNEPLPLLLLERPCLFRQAALDALDRAGIKWRIAVTSPTQGGLWAAAQVGIGVTVRTEVSMPKDLANLGSALQLPKLPTIDLSILRSDKRPTPVIERLEKIIIDVLRENLGDRVTKS